MPNQIATPQNQNNFLLQVATPTNNQTVSMRGTRRFSPKLNFGVQYNLNQAQSSGQGLFPSETSSVFSRAQVVNLTFNQKHYAETDQRNCPELHADPQQSNQWIRK